MLFYSFLFRFIGFASLSQLFSKFDIQRKLYRSYLISLPLSKWTIFYNDYAFVGTLQTVFFIVLYTIVYLSVHFNIFYLMLEFMVSMLFLSCTYYPQVTYKRYGTIISLLIMTLFSWANYFLIDNIRG